MAYQLHTLFVMKIMLATNDADLIQMIKGDRVFAKNRYIIHNQTNNPLDLMSAVFTINPSLLILDDDFLKPNTAHILRSIKKVRQNIYVIFITSDSSINLGREVSQLGIQFYALKPLAENDLIESVKSITQLKVSKNQFDLN